MDNAPTNGTDSAQTTVSIQVEIQADPTVNYASYQNNVPLVRSLTLTNATDEPLRDVEIVVRCEPVFADAMRLRFALTPERHAGSMRSISSSSIVIWPR